MADLQLGWIALGLALALLGLFAGLRAREVWSDSGLPAGEIIYSDSGAWYPQDRPLYDAEWGLTGRPDYLVEQEDGAIVPVELKSGKAPVEPHEGHVLQLAAYCLLVERVYGQRPAYGILQYRDKAFAVDYTPELEEDLLYLLDEMREDLWVDDPPRDHNDWRRCASCPHRGYCSERLG